MSLVFFDSQCSSRVSDIHLNDCVQGGVYVPISNLSVTAKYLPPLPVGGPYLSGYGALQQQFPVVYDVYFLLNYYGKRTSKALDMHRRLLHSSATKTTLTAWWCMLCAEGTSVSYQLDVLSMNDVLLTSSTHTVNPLSVRFSDVSYVHTLLYTRWVVITDSVFTVLTGKLKMFIKSEVGSFTHYRLQKKIKKNLRISTCS